MKLPILSHLLLRKEVLPQLWVLAATGNVFCRGVNKRHVRGTLLKYQRIGQFSGLDRSIHVMFDSGSLSHMPYDFNGTPITMANRRHKGSYLLEVDYRKRMRKPEFTQSTRIISPTGYNTVYPKTKVSIFYYPNWPQNIQTLPCPDYFTLHSVLVWLRLVCLNHAAAEFLASPIAK